MRQPRAVRTIVIIAWLRVILSLFVVAFAIYAAIDERPANEFVRDFRAGFLESGGYSETADFDAEDAGRYSAGPILAIGLAALLLFCVRRRKLVAARITEGVTLLLSLGSLAMLVSIVVLVLLFTPSVTRYFRGARQDHEPARLDASN